MFVLLPARRKSTAKPCINRLASCAVLPVRRKRERKEEITAGAERGKWEKRGKKGRGCEEWEVGGDKGEKDRERKRKGYGEGKEKITAEADKGKWERGRRGCTKRGRREEIDKGEKDRG